jgi:hypothetical protein
MTRAALALLLMAAAPARADDAADVFANAANGAKVHVASGFVCPVALGRFWRDAVGARDPENGEDFCVYSALDGVYGTIALRPLKGPYDPKTALVAQFLEQEHTGARLSGEAPVGIAGASVYTRSYRVAGTAEFSYRVLFAASAVGNWALEVTLEYASPRDDALEKEFLGAVYTAAFAKIARP